MQRSVCTSSLLLPVDNTRHGILTLMLTPTKIKTYSIFPSERCCRFANAWCEWPLNVTPGIEGNPDRTANDPFAGYVLHLAVTFVAITVKLPFICRFVMLNFFISTDSGFSRVRNMAAATLEAMTLQVGPA